MADDIIDNIEHISNSNNTITGSDNKDDLKNQEVIHDILEEKKESEKEIYADADLRIVNSMEINLGRLKKTLSEKCECGTNLQLRIRQCETVELGDEVLEDETYKYCPNCEIEYYFQEKRQRRKRDKTNRDIDLESNKKDGGRNGRYQKRGGIKKDFRENSNGSYRKR